MRAKGVSFATLTHAAGISSTDDAELDLRLPFDEPYRIPEATAAAIRRTQADGGRIVAVGTTVVRALEHPAVEGSSGRVKIWLHKESVLEPSCGLLTRFFPEPTTQAAATTSCSAPLLTMPPCDRW